MTDDHAATKALPDDLLAYMRRHIKAKRDDLDGFLAIGNEVNRAATYDRWLVALSAPAAPVAPAGLHVGNLPTVNQDEYPNLGAWWVQIWDGDRVVGRAYGDTPHAAHEMAVKLSGNAAHSPAPASQSVSEPDPAAPVSEPAGRWTGDDAIESPHNACQHRGYCLSLKAAPRAPLRRDDVMSALALVPTDMSHPDKCEWIASYLNGIGQEGGAA